MCDFGLIAGLASTAIGAMGAAQAGQAAQKSADYNAKVMQMNAQLNEKRAQDAMERGKIAEQQQQQKGAMAVARQKVGLASGNVDTSFGSPMDSIIDASVATQLDSLTVRSNTYREAHDYRVAAWNNNTQAELTRYEGKAKANEGYLSALGTVIGGAGDAYKSWKKSSSGVGSIA